MDAAYASARTSRPTPSAGAIRFIRQTGFYPLYDGENDQVDPIGPVRRTRFQRVVPRYRLSASETNDSGLGPPFYEIPVYTPENIRPVRQNPGPQPGDPKDNPANASATADGSRVPLEPYQGSLVDFYA